MYLVSMWTVILIGLFFIARFLVEVSTWISYHYDYQFSDKGGFLIKFVNTLSYFLGVALLAVGIIGLVEGITK